MSFLIPICDFVYTKCDQFTLLNFYHLQTMDFRTLAGIYAIVFRFQLSCQSHLICIANTRHDNSCYATQASKKVSVTPIEATENRSKEKSYKKELIQALLAHKRTHKHFCSQVWVGDFSFSKIQVETFTTCIISIVQYQFKIHDDNLHLVSENCLL